MRNLYYIAIEGPIGVGKTSLAELLSKELGARLVLEDFEDNPFLPDFYYDPERFGFQTQLFFLLQRYRQQQDLRQVDMFQKLLITDYMFVKDRYVKVQVAKPRAVYVFGEGLYEDSLTMNRNFDL